MLFLQVLVFSCAVIVCCVAIPITEELLKGKYEYEFVDIDSHVVQPYSGEKTYNIKTKAFGKDFDLHLKKLPTIFSKNFQFLSLELDENKQPVFKKEILQNLDEPVYRDADKNSVLHVDFKNGEMHLEGSLTPELSIVHSSQVLELKNPTGNHVIVKTNYKKSFMDKMLSFKPNRLQPRGGYASAEPVPELVKPELLPIMDYKSVERLQFDTSKVQKYLAIFWHAVNTRYELVTNPRYQLMVVGVVATKDKSLQPYIELSRTKTGDMIDLTETLPYLNTFLYHNLKNLPDFDIAMLMTGEDMSARDQTGEHNPNIAGVAYFAGGCSWDPEMKMTLNAGMGEDTAPFYDGVLTHAHEVAHLLGSVHDGDGPDTLHSGHPGAADCPWRDGYLMSYLFGTKNHLHWSDCTIKQFRWFVNLPTSDCLRKVSNDKQLATNKTLPGQLVSLDDQCRAYMGPRGLFYRGQDMEKICVILYCYYEGEENASSRGPVLEGSPCGYTNGMWCRDGECVRRTVV